MKVLFVLDLYHSQKNGTSVSAQRYVQVLRRMGHDVRVLAVKSDNPQFTVDYPLPEAQVYGFRHMIHAQNFAYAKPDDRMIRIAVQWADIVHCMMPFPLTWRTIKIANELGKPMTAAFHIQAENISTQFGLGKVKWVNDLIYNFMRTSTYDHFTHVHTPSLFMAGELKKHGYQARLYPISNGISPQCGYRKEEKPQEWQDKIVISMVGRLSQEKRQDVIIRAAGMSKYAERIQLVFAGQGPKQREYEKLARKLANRPVFAHYSKTDLLTMLAQCDLYVHASDMESEAISCIEATAMGLVPVIAKSEQSAAWQFALHEHSYFHPGDARDLARQIDYWIEHEEERKQMEHVYADAAEQYKLDACVARFEQMLRDKLALCQGIHPVYTEHRHVALW